MRRASGEGSITEYRKGKWRAYLDFGKDANGKRIRKTFTGSTKAEVIQKLNKAKYEKQEGILTINARTPVRKYIKHWLEYKTHSLKPTTIASYENDMKVYVLPLIGDKAIEEITTKDINNLLISPIALSHASASRARVKAVLSNVFKLAVVEGLIKANPVSSAEVVKKTPTEIHPLSVDEVQRLLAVAFEYRPMYQIIQVALETGLRRGEILGLHWSDIDISNKTLTVNRILTEVNGTQYVSTPKTIKSRRTIAISEELIKTLQSYHSPSEIIFGNQLGKYPNITKLKWQFHGIKIATNLPHLRFHDLRHTNATYLIAKGVNMKTVSERLGHSSISITLDRYTHGVLEEDRKAASTLAHIIKPVPKV